MKGISAVVTSMILILVALLSAGSYYIYSSNLSNSILGSASRGIIYPESPPQLGTVVCYPGYGWVDAMNTSVGGINGTVLYSVKSGNRTVRNSTSVNIIDIGRIYFSIPGETGDTTHIRIYTPDWETTAGCTVRRDHDLALHLNFDKGVGTTLVDKSGQGNIGTFYGQDDGTITDAVWTTGFSNSALSFDGDSDYVITDYDGDFKQEVTFMARFKITDWESRAVFGRYHYNPQGLGWMLYRNSPWTNGQLGWLYQYNKTDGSQGYILSIYSGLNTDTWYQASVVFYPNGSYIRYLNGTYTASGTASDFLSWGGNTTDPSVKLAIGRAGESAGWWFNGTIDDVRVYSRALDSVEIQQAYQGVHIQDGLAAYWNLDEGAGTVVRDTHMWAGGISGNALYFDGIDDYVNVPDGTSLDQSDAITVLVWVNRFKASVQQGIVSKGLLSSNPRTWDFGIASNNNFFWYIANSNSNFKIKYAASSGTDQWEHIVGVFNGTHTSVFVDGEQITTELFGWDSLQTSDTSLHIGKLRNQLDYFNGIIDDVRIYDRVLTAQEIQALYIAYH